MTGQGFFFPEEVKLTVAYCSRGLIINVCVLQNGVFLLALPVGTVMVGSISP